MPYHFGSPSHTPMGNSTTTLAVLLRQRPWRCCAARDVLLIASLALFLAGCSDNKTSTDAGVEQVVVEQSSLVMPELRDLTAEQGGKAIAEEVSNAMKMVDRFNPEYDYAGQ